MATFFVNGIPKYPFELFVTKILNFMTLVTYIFVFFNDGFLFF